MIPTGPSDWRNPTPLTGEYEILDNLRLAVVNEYGKFLVFKQEHRDALDAFESCDSSPIGMWTYEKKKRVLLTAQCAASKAHAAFERARSTYENTAKILAEEKRGP